MKKNEQTHYLSQRWWLKKWSLFMWNVWVLLLAGTLQLSAGGLALAQKVSIKANNADLKSVIAMIEQQTKFGFLYDEQEVKAVNNLTLHVTDMEVQQVLDQLLSGSKLTYSLDNRTIVISRRTLGRALDEVKNRMVMGKVTDMQKNPLPGVSVFVKGTTYGVATDINGEYKIMVPDKKGLVLVFSFVGMKSKEITPAEGQRVNVVLSDAVADLDEVTVVGYGERKKRELISSISSVKAEDLKERPAASIETLLQGQMSGVAVTNASGAPGGGGTVVNIRGYNSMMINSDPNDPNGKPVNDGTPLYIIDGVPVNSFTSPVTGTNTMSEIDPSTIESVEVLKDAASAAIYGSRAGNGVILITTKKGKSGKAKFSGNVSYSYSILPETPYQMGGNMERRFRILAARNIREGYWDWQRNNYVYPNSYQESFLNDVDYDYFWNKGVPLEQGVTHESVDRALQDSLNPFYNNSTDWYRYAFRAGKVWNGNLQASGGTDNIKYLVGLGIYDEQGIMYGSDFTRMNLISNINATPRKNLSLDARIYLAYTDRSRGKANTSGIAPSRFEKFTVDPSSMTTLYPGNGAVEDEALRLVNESSEKLNSFRLRTSFGLKYDIIKGLSLSTNVALDYTQSNRNSFEPSFLDKLNNWSISQGYVNGDIMVNNDNLLNYKFKVKGKHNFDLLLGFTYNRTANTLVGGEGKGAPSNHIIYVGEDFPSLAPDASGRPVAMQMYRSKASEKIMLSYFGRIAYNFNEKYLMEASLRRDGSSVFGKNVRWANFPSVAVGWAFSEENFMKDLWWLSYGKIRGSWGTSGQEFSEPYLAHGTLEIGGSFLGNVGLQPSQILNADLTWEESEQYDLGIDVDFFDYRLKFKTDYYYKYSKSLLYRVPLPGDVYAHDKSWQNAMEISNQGWEVELVLDVFRESQVKWRSRFNISRNWNRFEKSSLNVDLESQVIGRPMFGIYAFKDKGIIQSEDQVPYYFDQSGAKLPLRTISGGPFVPGMRLVEDLNNDGQIDPADDSYYACSALPTAYGGWANEITWKDFDLSFMFTYTLGRHLVNGMSDRSLMYRKGDIAPIFANVSAGDFWQQPGDQTKYPSVSSMHDQHIAQFDGTYDSAIEKVNFLRLQQLTLGYDVPKTVIKKIGIDGVRVFFTGENLFLWTNYSGLDPEAVEPYSGIDYGSNYPLARKLTLGLTVNF